MTTLTDTAAPRRVTSLADRYTLAEGTVFMTGLQALVRVLIDQARSDRARGLHTAGLVSGYPGSPVGSLDLELESYKALLSGYDIVHQPGLNEDLAATAVFGSQTVDRMPSPRYDGVFGMWFGKAPGVDRTTDAFRHANWRGVAEHGGVVAVAGDDPGAKSSILPSDSTAAFVDLAMPVLAPGDVRSVLELGLHGYALSRASGLWVGMCMVADVADGGASVEVGRPPSPAIPVVEVDGRPFSPELQLNTTGVRMIEPERLLHDGRLEVARRYIVANGLNRVVVAPHQAHVLLVGVGKAYFDLRQALADAGLDDRTCADLGIRVAHVAAPFPLDAEQLRGFAGGVDRCIVFEEKRPLVETALREALYGRPNAPVLLGKHDEEGRRLVPVHGQSTVEVAASVLARVLRPVALPDPIAERMRSLARVERPRIAVAVDPTAGRTAFFCSGCPHNRSLVAPGDAVVGAGIGCHILGLAAANREEFGAFTGYTQMGGEGAQFVGAAPFVDSQHFIQNLGDGTLSHSGSLAIRFAVASGIDITYKILYNAAVAMTGGQTVTGLLPVPALCRVLLAEGVASIVITTEEPERYRGVELPEGVTVRHRDELLAVQEELGAVRGVTVLLHDQQCAAEKRRDRKRGVSAPPRERVVIHERVCEGCGDCAQQSGCLSVQPVETAFGQKTMIHQSSCNLDFSCLLGDCPSFLTVESASATRATRAALPEPLPPEPDHVRVGDDFDVVMTGIGGTGVVTVNRILATAAMMAGRNVRTLDQTGSSQKAGPVVSHLKVMTDDRECSGSVSPGAADAYVVFDALVGSEDRFLQTVGSSTVAVVSATATPTGRMVLAAAAPVGVGAQVDRIQASAHGEGSIVLDAGAAAEALVGDHMAGNLLLVGAALQAGALALPMWAVEDAIRLNGTAVEANLAAFHWGRTAVADAARFEAALRPPTQVVVTPSLPAALAGTVRGLELPDDVNDDVARYTAELVAYQDARYARRYLELLRTVRDAERRALGGRAAVSAAVAAGAFKVMAYKDEYEVARLLLDPVEDARLRAEFGPDARVSWNLHPPVLRSLGMGRKIRLGPGNRPVLAALRRAKGLRGTRLDVFGRTLVRRTERALIEHHRELVLGAAAVLTAENEPLVVEVGRLPELVRGYEHVKLRSVETYLARAAELGAELGIGSTVEVSRPGRDR